MTASWLTEDKKQDPIRQAGNMHKLKPQDKRPRQTTLMFNFRETLPFPAAQEWPKIKLLSLDTRVAWAV